MIKPQALEMRLHLLEIVVRKQQTLQIPYYIQMFGINVVTHVCEHVTNMIEAPFMQENLGCSGSNSFVGSENSLGIKARETNPNCMEELQRYGYWGYFLTPKINLKKHTSAWYTQILVLHLQRHQNCMSPKTPLQLMCAAFLFTSLTRTAAKEGSSCIGW